MYILLVLWLRYNCAGLTVVVQTLLIGGMVIDQKKSTCTMYTFVSRSNPNLDGIRKEPRGNLLLQYYHFICLETHITTFVDYGYTFICHMENEDRKALKENVASITCDDEKEIEVHAGAGDIGIKVFKMACWKIKCKSYFNRYYKTSNIIMVPSDGDIIMNTFSFLCSESKGRGFVFKNYDIVKHLEFLGYTKVPLLGAAPTSKNISYIAYIEQKNTIFICEKVSNGSSMHQCLKNITTMVKYVLTLFDKEIQASRVTVIGLLIRENGKQEKSVKCNFCRLFSLSSKEFESPAALKDWWKSIENYEGWWNLVHRKKQNKLLGNLAAEILCFMAAQEKGLPSLTDDKSEQFKQSYFLYTPQQMDIHFSDAKHVVIQGSYGSGKSILGLKKLEMISKNSGLDEKIIYINFDCKSNLHICMEKNIKEYTGISSRKIKLTNNIQAILGSPDQSIYVYHNSAGEKLSAILQETLRLNRSTSELTKTNYHVIVEEYDGETLSHDEAAKITMLVKGSNLLDSNVILLAQPLMKNRCWNVGKKSYEKGTCMFHELKNTFKIVELKEVLRCSNNICGITKCTQNFVQNKDSVFKTKVNKLPVKQRQKQKDNKKHIVSPSVPETSFPEVGTSTKKKVSNPGTSLDEKVCNPSNDSSKPDKSPGHGLDLDQAFKRSTSLKKSKSKIVSKFGFLCEPKQGVDIEGLKPRLVEFSEDINLSSGIAVIALALVLKTFIGENETTTVLHMTDEQPRILRRAIQLLPKLLDETFSYTQDLRVYLQNKKQFKTIFSSSFCSVNGMEFDHVVIIVSQSDYYLKYYLPQVISRCTYDLTFVLLPKDKLYIKKGFLQKLSNLSSRARNDTTKETVENVIEELKRECLLKRVFVAECKACKSSCACCSISNGTDDKQTFGVHTHSGQYQKHLSHVAEYTEFERQEHSTSVSCGADAK